VNSADISKNPRRKNKSVSITLELPRAISGVHVPPGSEATRVTIGGGGLTNRHTPQSLNYLGESCAGICAYVARCRRFWAVPPRAGLEPALRDPRCGFRPIGRRAALSSCRASPDYMEKRRSELHFFPYVRQSTITRFESPH
jgi:hypothetical protein